MSAPPLMPGDGKWSHALPLVRDPLTLCEQARPHGPVVALRVGWARMYMVNAPEAVRRVLVENVGSYLKTTRGYDKLRLSLGNGLVTSEGDFWLRQRRIAQPAFRKKALAGFAGIMGRHVERAAGLFAARAAEGPVDVVSPLNRMALEIVAEALFGADVADVSPRVEQGVNDLVEPFWLYTTAPYPWPEWVPRPLNWRFWRGRRVVRRETRRLVAEARRSPEREGDLLTMLMGATDPETGEAMSDAQLIDESLTLLGAGHETTANAMAFALDLLARHPEIADRVAAEAEAVCGDGPPDAAQIGRLVYTRQVLDETLRLYPPVWMIARRAEADDTLAGYAIDQGAFILLPIWSIHRDPDLWPDPERFDPDRFAPDAPTPDRGAYLPFSRGRRQCIGDRFAIMEAVSALAVFCRRFALTPVGALPRLKPALTLRPADGISVGMRPR